MSDFDIKKAGLGVAEDSAKAVISKLVVPFAHHYIANSPNKIDDILLPFLGELEKALLDLADKIDQEPG